MIKFRLYYDKDVEEEFLNNMSQKGYELKNFCCGFYTFEKDESAGYTYRIDCIGNKSKEELEDYMELIHDMGAILVKRWGPWLILKKKGEFELYTDLESKIKLYSKIRNMFFCLFIVEVLCAIIVFNGLMAYMNAISCFNFIIICAVIIAFLRQVEKCNEKIKMLKKE